MLSVWITMALWSLHSVMMVLTMLRVMRTGRGNSVSWWFPITVNLGLLGYAILFSVKYGDL